MDITVNSQVLAVELRLLNKVVPTKPAIAILSYMLIRADNAVRFYATDLEVGLSGSCDGRVDAPGSVALPVARLFSLVEQFPDDDVRVISEGARVHVRCGAFKSQLASLPVDDFPTQPTPDGTANTLDASTLALTISRTRYAVNDVASRHMLRGALLTMSGQTVGLVATDGKRLALATMARRSGSDVSVIIPAKALDALSAQLGSGDVDVTVGSRHLFFATGGRVITSRMIDGQYPEYKRIIPIGNDKVVTADRGALIAALRRVVLIAEENGAVYLNFAPGILNLTAASVAVGSASEELGVDYQGPPIKVCIRGSYLLDFLDAAANQSVSVALRDENSAALLADSEDHIAVIMLMRA